MIFSLLLLLLFTRLYTLFSDLYKLDQTSSILYDGEICVQRDGSTDVRSIPHVTIAILKLIIWNVILHHPIKVRTFLQGAYDVTHVVYTDWCDTIFQVSSCIWHRRINRRAGAWVTLFKHWLSPHFDLTNSSTAAVAPSQWDRRALLQTVNLCLPRSTMTYSTSLKCVLL